MDSFCGSEFWDVNLTWNTDAPDFTPCFQHTVLVWIPCGFLWLFTGLEFYFIISSKLPRVPWRAPNLCKFLLLILLIVLSCTDFLISTISHGEKYLADYTSPLIKICTYSLSAILMIANKARGIKNSGILFIFWFLMVCCGVIQFRWDLRNIVDNGCLSCSSFVIQYVLAVIIFIFNCFADRGIKVPKNAITKPWPESSVSFLSRVLYGWLDHLIWVGYRRPLRRSDLWSINPKDTAEETVPIFQKYWAKAKDNKRSIRNVSVAFPLWMSVWKTAISGFIILFFNDLIGFANPQILKLLIGYVENGDEPQWRGFFYVFLLMSVLTLQMFCLNKAYEHFFVVGLRMRTVLISALYSKALRISNTSRKDFTVGEIVNLMAVDIERLMQVTLHFHLIWAAPIQIGLVTYFLWNMLGPTVLAGLVVIVVLIPINSIIIRRSKHLQSVQMKEKDKRMKVINEILNAIKILKLYAWEESFEQQIINIRNKELEYLKKAIYYKSSVAFTWTCAPFLISVAVFGTFINLDPNNVLDAKTAFVSIALLNMLRAPLKNVSELINRLIQGSIAIKRINKFMNAAEVDLNNVSHDRNEKYPLIIEDGNFFWDENFALSKINVQIEKGTLTTIVGNIGSGKSSLISAFLGEMNKIDGYVNTSGSIAYVSQQAWIQNATFRENITFGKPFDLKRYKKVIYACALQPDLEMFPNGELTEIGEKGINLSGGQKQRVSLARAIYADADNYFFDDPLSAVDSHVGKHIFNKVIGPHGIIRNKTRVLITHTLTYLPEADLIVLLKNGVQIETGTYKELMKARGVFADFITQFQENQDDDSVVESDLVQESEKQKFYQRQISNNSQISHRKHTASESSGEENAFQLEKLQSSYDQRLIKEEHEEVGMTKWIVYKKYIKAMGLFFAITTIVTSIMLESFSILGKYWLSIWASDENSSEYPDFYFGIYALFGLLQAFSAILSELCPLMGCWLAARMMHTFMLGAIMRAPISFFDTTPQGRITSRFSRDVDLMDSNLPTSITNVSYRIFQVILALIVISVSTPPFALVAFPIIIIFFVCQRIYTATSRQLKRLESVSRSPIYSHFGESIIGTNVIRAFKAQRRFIDECDEKIDLNQMCHYPSIIANRWLGVRLKMIGNTIIFFAALFAVLARDSIDPGIMGLSITFAIEISDTLNFLTRNLSEVENNIVAVERIDEYGRIVQEAPWFIKETMPTSNWPSKGVIKFENYAVRYRPELDLILKNVYIKIRSGEKIGIVGRTGAGKSSLTLALFRILEPTFGSIFIDGVDISTLGLHTLRTNLTIIPQDPVLFSGSLRLNLDPFESCSDNELWRALDLAHLKGFVQDLPYGLQHKINEGGDNLSVGQKQLICLARALLRKSKILVLDEATAAVDLETDDYIQQTIRKEFSDCTVLTIAHRLYTILDSDRVLVLSRGSIVEFDSPDNLLQNPNSEFYRMAKNAAII